ncbi:uncharacterized protein [Coffea arabica]|uniref:Uncharacterized protein isoform X1 n=1 Tax=Coffea arabica TaxID=13443 RepID=A0A6P6XD78_COFAR|nr:uncharacterized protein LOC113742196 isoform X1 [Coffea arabica]
MAEVEAVIKGDAPVSVPVPLPVVPEGDVTAAIVNATETSETRMNGSSQTFNGVLEAGQGRTGVSGQASKKESESSQAILPWVIFGAVAVGVAAAATIYGAVVFAKKSSETLESADKLFKSLTALAKKWAAAPPADVHIDKVLVNVDHTR